MVREMIKKNSDKYDPDLPQVMLVSLVRYLKHGSLIQHQVRTGVGGKSQRPQMVTISW